MADNILSREVAGIPVGVWGVVIAGALGIAYVMNRGQSSEGVEQPLVDTGVGTGLIPAGAGFQDTSGTDGGADEGEPENNSQWGIRAKNWLIAQGHNPTVADNAIRKYLVAEQLTVQENALIALVLAASGLGSPPEDLPPAPDPEQPSEGAGVPVLDIATKHRTAKRATFATITGRATIDGESPGLQLINVRSRNPKGRTLRRWVVPTDTDGNFTTTVGGWGASGSYRYHFTWKGNEAIVTFRIS